MIPLKCPSCGCYEGEVHKDACAIYNLPGDKRQIYFAPSPEVKAAIPYTPGERQAVAKLPMVPGDVTLLSQRRINLDPPKDPLKDALDYLAQEFIKERARLNTAARHDAILKAIDAIQALRFLENK